MTGPDRETLSDEYRRWQREAVRAALGLIPRAEKTRTTFAVINRADGSSVTIWTDGHRTETSPAQSRGISA